MLEDLGESLGTCITVGLKNGHHDDEDNLIVSMSNDQKVPLYFFFTMMQKNEK